MKLLFSLILKHSVNDHRWQQNQTVTFNERTTVQRKRSVSNRTIFNDDLTRDNGSQLAGILLRILIKFRVSAVDNWDERCTITGVRCFD